MQFRGHNTKRLTLAGWWRLHGQADTPTLRRRGDQQNVFTPKTFLVFASACLALYMGMIYKTYPS